MTFNIPSKPVVLLCQQTEYQAQRQGLQNGFDMIDLSRRQNSLRENPIYKI